MRQFPRLLIKADAIPPDARWITVHPNGPGSKGQAVLIQPHPDGSARVIGGAGGSLNYLKLRGVKSHSDYKAEAGKKAADKRAARKEQVAADKAAGIHGAKEQVRQDIKEQRQKAERSVIQAVAKKAGWEPEELEFPEEDYEHLSEGARSKVRDKFHRDLLSKAKEVIQQSRQMLVLSPDARAEAGVGEVPLHSDSPDEIAADDLDPVRPPGAGLGFQPDYKGRAEAAGLSQDGLDAEAVAVKTAGLTPEQRQKALAKGEAAKLIKQELAGIKEPAAPNADASLISAKDALELVKEGKKLALIEKAAREANADVDKSAVEPKAFVLETSDDVDSAVQQDLANDLRTAQTRAFLSEVGKIAGAKPDETLGGHMGVGAYNSLNALAMAVGGDALVDRSVVDVLGVAGAAQVLARRLHSDLTPEDVQHVADGVQDWHVNHYMTTSTKALKQARELTDAAAAIELSDDAKTGTDLAVAQELNSRRRAAVGDAQRILGQALGEMEANAALVMAMKGPGSGDFQVSLGTTSPEQAITQVRAIGLQPGDYSLERVGGDTFLTVTPAGMARLAKPVAREDIAQVQRNLAIMRGDKDEDGWLPQGVANRPDMLMDVKPGVAERMAQPFQPGADLQASLRTYIGARAADGDAPADILSDIQSADFYQKVGQARTEAYRDALDSVAPLKGADGKQQRAEALADTFDKYADEHVAALGGERTTLNRQKFAVDQQSVDALHRALAETPEATAAYKQIGELTNKDQAALREHFYQHIAREDAEAGAMRKELEQHVGSEPEKESTDMFGDTVPNPDWQDWKTHRDGMAAKLNASSLTWSKYLKTMGGNERAYEAVQDVIRSKVASSFVDTHNKLNPDAPIKLGKRTIRNNLNHLDAVDPEAREARIAKDKELVDRLRNRVGGKYASGSVADKIDAAKQEQAAFEQAQMGFFSSEDAPEASGPGQDGAPAPLGADERHTLGHAAERQIAAMVGHIGENFKAGQPTKLWGISMSGKYAAQQRAIKLVEANKRAVLAAGAGSGKTNMMLGAHAHLASQGKIKRSIMMVPSIVQGQFSGEALRLLEPGKFKAHIQPGASQAERIAAYKDPSNHICVMTHQSFRDDMVHMGAKHAGVDEGAMVDRLQGMTPAQRKDWAAGVMAKEGINFDASFVDESHDTLNRAGKENSSLSNVIEAVGHHTPYHVLSSGDPVKNDASEIHSMLQKMDPERYGDRAAFMRRYGSDTIASKQALQREMARYVFPTSITPDVAVSRSQETVPLSKGQQQALGELDKHLARARLAQRAGKVDVEAVRHISPSSFDGVPDEEHEAVAAKLQKAVGMLKSSAVNRVINTHPDNAKIQRAVEMVQARPGKQGVIFARNREAVAQYQAAMEKAGRKVVVITGADSAKEKDRKRRMFNPEQGEAQADVLIASDAGAVGMNLQSGQFLIQHDISQTAKTHSQRNARIHRLGQKKGVELIDLHGDHPEERRSRERLDRKYGLKNMMASPLDGLDDTGVAGAIHARRAAAQSDQPGLF
jgi:Helicase conserved C-terminal domain/Type III restriction enzyme, res subunit